MSGFADQARAAAKNLRHQREEERAQIEIEETETKVRREVVDKEISKLNDLMLDAIRTYVSAYKEEFPDCFLSHNTKTVRHGRVALTLRIGQPFSTEGSTLYLLAEPAKAGAKISGLEVSAVLSKTEHRGELPPPQPKWTAIAAYANSKVDWLSVVADANGSNAIRLGDDNIGDVLAATVEDFFARTFE